MARKSPTWKSVMTSYDTAHRGYMITRSFNVGIGVPTNYTVHKDGHRISYAKDVDAAKAIVDMLLD